MMEFKRAMTNKAEIADPLGLVVCFEEKPHRS